MDDLIPDELELEAKELNKTEAWRRRRRERSPRYEKLKMVGWRPGQSGNPAGAPVGGYIQWSKRIKVYLEEHPEKVQEILVRWVEDAAAGVPGARETLIDRADGKVFAMAPALELGEVKSIKITAMEIVSQAAPGQPLLPFREVVVDTEEEVTP